MSSPLVALALWMTMGAALPQTETTGGIDDLRDFGAASEPSPPWRLDLLPGGKIPPTRFVLREVDGRRALEMAANASFGNLTHPFPPATAARRLSWSWRVGQFANGVDLKRKQGDDNAAKVCAAFDLPLERVPWLDRMILKRARERAKSHLPAATVCYVWDARLEVGTRIQNPFSGRLRYIVLRRGLAGAGEWHSEARDLGADFIEAFGRESDLVPALIAISVGADSDNTRGISHAWISDLRHR